MFDEVYSRIMMLNESSKPGEYRSLEKIIVVPEVMQALRDFVKCAPPKSFVIIGGLVVGAHARPRMTLDVDLILLQTFNGMHLDRINVFFKKTREHAYTHKATGVEIETLTSEYLGLDTLLVEQVKATAQNDKIADIPVLVASPAGMIALKLQRCSPQDRADIFAIVLAQGVQDLSNFTLSTKQIEMYNLIVKEAKL